MSDDKTRQWEDRERAEYFAHQKFYDFDGREISRDEAMRLACSENGFIHTNAPHLVAVDRSVIEEALEQIEAGAEIYGRCRACKAHSDWGWHKVEHFKDCRYVRVRDALKKALGT